MNEKRETTEYAGAYQTGSTVPPKSHHGLIAFLLGLVIFLCGISTALGLLNIRLFRQLSSQTENTRSAVSFSDGAEADCTGEYTILGVTGENIPDFWHTYHDLPQGVVIQAVDETSDACAQGIRPGDILVGVNGTEIASMEELTAVLETCQTGQGVTVELYRESGDRSFTLTIQPIS